MEKKLSKKDFESDQTVRWCPGCGDFAVLATVQRALAEMGVAREQHVFVSGIGCSSRFPYYMNAYGFHSIHGRAPGIATGIKLANPELSVWLLTGDGDALSIGGNHFIHILRRNLDVNILLFNNKIYGLTKGQYSPTSDRGQVTKTSPYGSLEQPIHPISLALAAGATFAARAVATDPRGLAEVLRRAAAHKGAAVVEILQDCLVFNETAHSYVTDRQLRQQCEVRLSHGEPLTVGEQHCLAVKDCGITLAPVNECQPLVHDEQNLHMARLLADLVYADGAVPLGVFYNVQHETYEDAVHAQIAAVSGGKKKELEELLRGGDSWRIG